MADTTANQVGNQQPENTEWMYGDAGYSTNAALGTMHAAVGSYTGSLTAGSDDIVNSVVSKITQSTAETARAAGAGGAGGAGATAGTAGAAGATAGTAGGAAGTANLQDQAGITKK